MEINSVLQDSLEAKILGMYNAETGYTVAMSAYRVKEDIKSDVDDIVKCVKCHIKDTYRQLKICRLIIITTLI